MFECFSLEKLYVYILFNLYMLIIHLYLHRHNRAITYAHFHIQVFMDYVASTSHFVISTLLPSMHPMQKKRSERDKNNTLSWSLCVRVCVCVCVCACVFVHVYAISISVQTTYGTNKT